MEEKNKLSQEGLIILNILSYLKRYRVIILFTFITLLIIFSYYSEKRNKIVPAEYKFDLTISLCDSCNPMQTVIYKEYFPTKAAETGLEAALNKIQKFSKVSIRILSQGIDYKVNIKGISPGSTKLTSKKEGLLKQTINNYFINSLNKILNSKLHNYINSYFKNKIERTMFVTETLIDKEVMAGQNR